MRLEQLYYLVELSKTRSMSRLAENNYISHQSVSKAIYQLEEEYGIKLLNRSSKGVSLTETGREFAKKAAEIITKIGELDDFKYLKSDGKTNVPKSKLTISVGSNTGISILPDVITDFCRNNPCAKVKIVDQQHSDIIRDIENGKSDFALVVNTYNRLGDNGDTTVDTEKGLVFDKLFNDKLVIAVGKTHRLAAQKSVSMKQVMKEPLVLYEQQVLVNKLLYDYGNPNIYHVSNSAEVIKIMIEGGLALCIGKESMVIPIFSDKEKYRIIAIREKPKLVIGILYLMNHPFSPLAKEFICMLKSHY